MPLLDARTCDRLYHVGTTVPRAELIVLPGNLCAGYAEGHKDTCQVRESSRNLYSPCPRGQHPTPVELRSPQRVPPPGSVPWTPTQRYHLGNCSPGTTTQSPWRAGT